MQYKNTSSPLPFLSSNQPPNQNKNPNSLNFNPISISVMPRVYPKAVIPSVNSSDKPQFFTESSSTTTAGGRNLSPVILTVWKKSLLFNCDGFTVFNSKGNLVFRVDNYAAGNKAEVVLMDASGRSLLTIRRKRLSFSDNWLVYDGDTTTNPRFSVTKNVNFLNTKSLAHVTTTTTGSPKNRNKKNTSYEIEGSYSRRSCAMYDDKRRHIAELKRKEAVRGVALGGDVFHLVVQPEIDSVVAMALVVVLDQMFGGSSKTR